MRRKKVALVVLDGFGEREDRSFNAVKLGSTPVYDNLKNKFPFTLINASGEWVGLKKGDMGNSEVGHNTMGAGFIYKQGAELVNEAFKNGTAFKSNCFNTLVTNCIKHDSTFHLVGLLSDGRVHSDIEQLKTLLFELSENDIDKVRLHILLDGRDVSPQSAEKYVAEIESYISSLGKSDYLIASGGGRMQIVMDRYEADWKMVEKGYNTIVNAEGKTFTSPEMAINYFREKTPNIVDQDIPPFVIVSKVGEPLGKVKDGDSLLTFNFRADRMVEFSRVFCDKNFSIFPRKNFPKIEFAGLMQYDGDLGIPDNFIVSPPNISHTLTEFLVKNKLKSFAVSETQKFGHITKYFNGNKQNKISEEFEDYVEIPSLNVPFNEVPEMKAEEVTDALISAIESGKYNFLRCNFANCDMVGHTGDLNAVIKAVETVDNCLGRVYKACLENKTTLFVVADHGNAEEMAVMFNGKIIPKTSHTTNPVPFIVADKSVKIKSDYEYGLSNLASSITKYIGIGQDKHWDDSIIK